MSTAFLAISDRSMFDAAEDKAAIRKKKKSLPNSHQMVNAIQSFIN